MFRVAEPKLSSTTTFVLPLQMQNGHGRRDSLLDKSRRRLSSPKRAENHFTANGSTATSWSHGDSSSGWRSTSKDYGRLNSATLSNIRFVALCSLWYFSSALSSNTGKAIMLVFRFPVTLTFVQFGFISTYCLLLASPAVRLTKIRKPSAVVLRSTLPMAAFQVGGHIFSSIAISRVHVSTVHTIKVIISRVSNGRRYSPLFAGLISALHSRSLRSTIWC